VCEPSLIGVVLAMAPFTAVVCAGYYFIESGLVRSSLFLESVAVIASVSLFAYERYIAVYSSTRRAATFSTPAC
jgi:hypothetical protein